MNKKVIGIAFVLLVLFTVAAFAQTRTRFNYTVTFQIINASTFEVINSGSLNARRGGDRMTDVQVKADIRRQLGWPGGTDQRSVSNVTQRLIWVNIQENRE
ncbi:MAG: hypothetical protein FWD14_00450 [Treponema sp.]|nr:hypothetical protein [Treponema sp.]